MNYTPSRGLFAGTTFPSRRQYRNALARRQGYASLSAQQRAAWPVRSPQALARLSPHQRATYDRALSAVNRMRRDGLSLQEAAREAGTTPNAVRRYAGAALEQHGNRIAATREDRLIRRMTVDTVGGARVLNVRGSRRASMVGRHAAAVRHYLETGDASRLRKFRGKYIQDGKLKHVLITDTQQIDRLARRGELSFEDLYDYAA
jgi:hypothetical protein